MVTLTQSREWKQKRFTEWYDGKGAGKPGKDCYTQLAKYEDLGLTPEELREVLRENEKMLIKKLCEVHAEVSLEVSPDGVTVSSIRTPELDKEIKLIRSTSELDKDVIYYERLKDLGEKRRTVYEAIESGAIYEKLKEDILEARNADWLKPHLRENPDTPLVWDVLVGTDFKGENFRYVCLNEYQGTPFEKELESIEEGEER